MSRTISQLTAGTPIWIYETIDGVAQPVPYIYIGQDENGKSRVLRKYALTTTMSYTTSTNMDRYVDYAGSVIDTFLEDDSTGFLSRLDGETYHALQNTTIYYNRFHQTDGIVRLSAQRRCFLMSSKEAGNGDPQTGEISYLPALMAYYQTEEETTARHVMMPDEYAGGGAWLRDAYGSGTFLQITSATSTINYSQSYSAKLLRPTLCFNPETPVSKVEEGKVFLLPSFHRCYWVVQAQFSMGKSERRPVRGKLFVPTSRELQSLALQVCNNYGDANPTWVNCANGGTAVFGTSKTASDWELGVKVNAQLEDCTDRVYEPVMAVVCEAGS